MNSIDQNPSLRKLLQRSDTWLGSRFHGGRALLATGHRQLDKLLSGGWPASGLIEIARQQCSELALLLPVLRQLHSQQRGRTATVLVAPPYQPNSEALQQAAIDVDSVVVVAPRSLTEWLWVVEQALHHDALPIAWLAPHQRPSSSQLRKLQLLASDRQLPATVVTRGATPLAHTVLRLQLQAVELDTASAQPALSVKVDRQRGQPAGGRQTIARTTLSAVSPYR